MLLKYVKHQKNSTADRSYMLGKEYIALSVIMNTEKNISKFLIKESEKFISPILFDAECFDILDNRIPDGWCFNNFDNASFKIYPKEFSEDFWDRYHNDGFDYDADKTLEEVIQKTKAFHGITS